MTKKIAVFVAAASMLLASSLSAQSRPAEAPRPIHESAKPQPYPPKPAVPTVPNPPETVDAFHHALRAGDRVDALELLAADVLVFEQGRLERSRAEYARSHLTEDMGFAAATQRTVSRRSVRLQGNTAWVLSVNRIRGKFNSKPVDLTTDETMILQRSGGRWRIAHIHWSFNDRGANP